MKSITSFGILFLCAFFACGKANELQVKISSQDSLKLNLYNSQSILYQDKNPDSAIYFAGKGLKLALKLRYLPGEAMMLNRFARINEQYGNFKLAVKYQKEALSLYTNLHSTLATDALAKVGILEAKQGNYTLGIKLTGSALSQYQKQNNIKGIISGYTNLGEIYELKGDHNNALIYYSKAEKLSQELPITEDYLVLISKIGKLHAKLRNHKEAAGYFEKGIKKSAALNHSKAHIGFLHDAGRSWDSLGFNQKAFAYHQQGLQKAKDLDQPEEQARSLMNLATSIQSQGADLSLGHLKNALTIAHSIGHKQLTAEIYRSLSDIYRQQNKYREALTALEEHHRLLDSLLNVNKGHRLAALQSSYELAESKLKVETLEMANRKKTYERNAVVIAAVAILVISLILSIYFIKTSRLNKKLEASNLVKDKLFSIIGHDLRNPIGGITQLLALMEEEGLSPEENQHMISEMRKQGDVSLEILNALLNWGQAQIKGIHIKLSEFSAKSVIAKNIEVLSRQAEDKSISIIDHTSSAITIIGDRDHFDFIIRNLMSNAIKFSHKSGKIELGAEIKPGSEQVIFSVKDEGKGISKAQQKLFIKSDLDISFGTSGEKGTGIGLMLSKEFVRANNGRIWLESEEGKGTTFYFTFASNFEIKNNPPSETHPLKKILS